MEASYSLSLTESAVMAIPSRTRTAVSSKTFFALLYTLLPFGSMKEDQLVAPSTPKESCSARSESCTEGCILGMVKGSIAVFSLLPTKRK